MGADCVAVPVGPQSSDPTRELEEACTGPSACIALSPDVIRAWLSTADKLQSLAAHITNRFQFVLLHELDSNEESERLLRAFSLGAFHTVGKPQNLSAGYRVSTDRLCEEFAGLEFGPITPADRLLIGQSGAAPVEPLVTAEGAPILVRLNVKQAEVFILGGIASGHVSLESDLTDETIHTYFREIAPLVLFLRRAFGEACWRPANPPTASFIVDDPPLWKRYGFLDYSKLLAMMDQSNFHTSIAFIPYYWKKTVPSTVQLFRERPERLSVCFHGNDHTAAELASQEPQQLNSMLATAKKRMESFTQRTGIPCDNVIVF